MLVERLRRRVNHGALRLPSRTKRREGTLQLCSLWLLFLFFFFFVAFAGPAAAFAQDGKAAPSLVSMELTLVRQ